MENDVLGIPVWNIPFMEGERERKCLNATFLALNITSRHYMMNSKRIKQRRSGLWCYCRVVTSVF